MTARRDIPTTALIYSLSVLLNRRSAAWISHVLKTNPALTDMELEIRSYGRNNASLYTDLLAEKISEDFPDAQPKHLTVALEAVPVHDDQAYEEFANEFRTQLEIVQVRELIEKGTT